MKKCPFCAEDIKAEAIKCKHCGEWLKEDQAPELNHFDNRKLCADGNCIGILDKDGRCRVCRKSPDEVIQHEENIETGTLPNPQGDNRSANKSSRAIGNVVIVIVIVAILAGTIWVKNHHSPNLEKETSDERSKEKELEDRNVAVSEAKRTAEMATEERIKEATEKQAREYLAKKEKAGKDSLVMVESNVGYFKNSVEKISDNIREVQEQTVEGNAGIIRTLRFNCESKEYAIGQTYGYKYGNLVSNMDLSRNGWVWFKMNENDQNEKKLLKILCKGQKVTK